jgi:hypothetical protein
MSPVMMAKNPVGMFYKWLELCARVIIKFVWCINIPLFYHIKKMSALLANGLWETCSGTRDNTVME